MRPSPSLAEAIRWAAQQLREAGQPSPQLEAETLLCHLLQKGRSHLYTWPEQVLTSAQTNGYHSLIHRRLLGEPIAYITGQREFWSLELQVTPDVLIPRADTELLVERALHYLAPTQVAWVADLGTGSGAIAAAIASERPLAQLIATDLSAAALAVAKRNFQRLDLRNIHTAQGHWCQALPVERQFELILSNPPYIANADPHLQQGDLRYEPMEALASGEDGFEDLRQICPEAMTRLAPGGRLLVEHGYEQGHLLRRLFHEAGFEQIATLRDLEGRKRVTEGRR